MPPRLHLSLATLALAAAQNAAPAEPTATPLAIVGVTVFDGNGGAPLSDAVVLIEGSRIRAAGPRASTSVPRGARLIDGASRFLIPGL